MKGYNLIGQALCSLFTPGIILQEVVEAKNATDIPEKTNVTEETIENIVLPEKVRHCRQNDPLHTMFSGCSRERALILPRHCIPSLHSHPHHLHDPRHASGLFSFDIILPTLWLLLVSDQVPLSAGEPRHCLPWCRPWPPYDRASRGWDKKGLFHYVDNSLGVDFFSSIGFSTRLLGWGVFPHNVLPHPPAPNHIWIGIQSPQGQFLSGKRFDIIFPCSLRFNYCHIFCRTSGVSWYLQFLELPYPLLWLEAASIYSALLTLSTRSHLFRALPLAHSSVLLIL